MKRQKPESKTASAAIAGGLALGAIVALPALGAAILSAGAGHGDYAAARALFPAPMLLTRIEGQIGLLTAGAALLQFPLYGALIGWSRRRGSYAAAAIAASLHLAAAVACFAGALPDFS